MKQPTVLHDSTGIDSERAVVPDGERRVDRSEATDPPPRKGDREAGRGRRDGADADTSATDA